MLNKELPYEEGDTAQIKIRLEDGLGGVGNLKIHLDTSLWHSISNAMRTDWKITGELLASYIQESIIKALEDYANTRTG